MDIFWYMSLSFTSYFEGAHESHTGLGLVVFIDFNNLSVSTLRPFLGFVLGLLFVDEIEPPGFNFPVNEGTSESSKEFFGEGVALGFTILFHVLLVLPGGSESGGSGKKLMRDLGLVVVELIVGLSLSGLVVEQSHGDSEVEVDR